MRRMTLLAALLTAAIPAAAAPPPSFYIVDVGYPEGARGTIQPYSVYGTDPESRRREGQPIAPGQTEVTDLVAIGISLVLQHRDLGGARPQPVSISYQPGDGVGGAITLYTMRAFDADTLRLVACLTPGQTASATVELVRQLVVQAAPEGCPAS